jgi:hypothetical protein
LPADEAVMFTDAVHPMHAELRDCQFAIEAGDAIFAPRMKALLLRAFVLVRRRHHLAESTRHSYHQRMERDLDAVMALMPNHSRWPPPAEAIRQSPQSPVHLPRSSRSRRRQQRQRT